MKKLYKGNEKAGEGGFGAVTVAKDLNSKSGKERVAIKRVPHDTARTQENNWTEISFLSASIHANIVQFKHAYLVNEDKEEICIVMEYLEGGTLGEAAAANALTEDHIAFVTHEILMALSYLHAHQWVHRDLKSANVMMSIKGEIKLIDFGLCADFSEGPRIQMLGSPYWIPPEMIWAHPHTYPADVWSMAVCILELLLTHPPHNESNIKGMFYVATKGLTDLIPTFVSAAGKAFLTRCLILDPEKRPTVADLLKDPWITRPSLNKGIDEVLRQVFLSASFSNLGF
jgi:p21-activated kinase 1